MFYKDVIDDEFVRRMMNYKLSNMIRAEKNDTLYRYRSMESAFIKDEMENLLIHKKVFFPSRMISERSPRCSSFSGKGYSIQGVPERNIAHHGPH